MDKSMVEQFRSRWQAVAAVEREAQRDRSFAQRWRQLNAIVRLAAALDLQMDKAGDQEEIVYQRWNRLREHFLIEQSRL